MVGVLGLQGGVLLADRFCLCGFTRGDLENVLLAAGLVGGTVALGLLGGLVGWLRRRPLQFNLRCLLLLTLAAAIPSGWYAAWVENGGRQERALAQVREIQARICSGKPHRQLRYGGKTLTVRPGSRPAVVGISFAIEQDAGCGCCYMNARSDVGDEDLDPLTCLYRLEGLNASDARITDAGLARLRDLRNLKELDLPGNAITDAGVAHLRGLKHLERLNLSQTAITDAGFVHLAALQNLRQLDFGSTRATGAGMKYLAGLPAFRQCGTSGSIRARFSVSGVNTCNALRQLEELYGGLVQLDTPGESQDTVELDGHPRLRVVDLENGLALRDMRLSRLAALKAVRISVGPCQHGVSYGVPQDPPPVWKACKHCAPEVKTLLLENLPQLNWLTIGNVRRLVLRGTPNVTQVAVADTGCVGRELFQELGQLSRLQYLGVSVRAFSSPDLLLALGRAPHLERLSISGSGLNDDSLAVLENTPAVKQLSWPAGAYSARGLARLKQLKSLEHLSLPGLRDAGEPLSCLAGATGVKSLYLGNAVLGKLRLADLPNLERLTLHGSQIGSLELENLPKLNYLGDDGSTAIRRLSVKGLPMLQEISIRTGSSQPPLEHVELERLPALVTLSLVGHGVWVTDDCLAHITTFTNLRLLELRDSSVTDRTIERLGQLPQLARVDLRNTSTTEAAAERLRNGGRAKISVSR